MGIGRLGKRKRERKRKFPETEKNVFVVCFFLTNNNGKIRLYRILA